MTQALRRHTRLIAAFLLIVSAVLLASCTDSGHGWSQENGDSEPYWR